MTSINDPQVNFKSITKAVHELQKKPQLFCLPENSLYLNLDKNPIPKSVAFHRNSPEILQLQELAVQEGLNIHLGGIPWLIENKVYNEALLIRKSGEVEETYEKIHLFDVNLGPGIEICESKSYNPGKRLSTFEIDGWKFATCICYDIRFPEIFIEYMKKDVNVFLAPAAFTTKTGETHWKSLLMARAIESQAYVLAPAQVGYHRDGDKTQLRKSWGQSLAIDPWGRVSSETGSYKDFMDFHSREHMPIELEMDKGKIISYCQSIPVREHRAFKMELYKK